MQLSDYSANFPGVNVIGGGMPGESLVVIRGFAVNHQCNVRSLLPRRHTDWTEWTLGICSCGAALDLLPYDLERLEVQRGPQGTLGGAGAEVGSIKYVLYPPTPVSSRHGSVRTSARSTMAPHPGGSVRAMVNVPLVDGQLAVRARPTTATRRDTSTTSTPEPRPSTCCANTAGALARYGGHRTRYR